MWICKEEDRYTEAKGVWDTKVNTIKASQTSTFAQIGDSGKGKKRLRIFGSVNLEIKLIPTGTFL